MKQYIKITIGVVVFTIAILFSKTIQNKCIESYNKSVTFMSNNTVGNSLALGI